MILIIIHSFENNVEHLNTQKKYEVNVIEYPVYQLIFRIVLIKSVCASTIVNYMSITGTVECHTKGTQCPH